MEFLKNVWELFELLQEKDFELKRFDCEGRKVTIEIEYHKYLLTDNIVNSILNWMRSLPKDTKIGEIKDTLDKMFESAWEMY